MNGGVQPADPGLTASLLEHALIAATHDLPHSCLDRLPVDDYVAAAGDCDPYDHQDPRPARQFGLLESVAAEFGAEVAVAMHRLALLRLALRRARSPQLDQLPQSVRLLTLSWLARIGSDALEMPRQWFDPDGADRLQVHGVAQDFSVAAGRALPVGGAWIVERRRLHDSQVLPVRDATRPGPARSAARRTRTRLLDLASRLGLRVALRNLRRTVEEFRGHYGVYYVIHTANRYRRQFTARQMEIGYANIAQLLQSDREALGIYRQSWFLDPEVAKLEPRLAFLAEVPRRHGAQLRRLGPFGADLPPAISEFSAVRRALREDGRYVPVEWGYVWPRDEVLRWASTARLGDHTGPTHVAPAAGTVGR